MLLTFVSKKVITRLLNGEHKKGHNMKRVVYRNLNKKGLVFTINTYTTPRAKGKLHHHHDIHADGAIVLKNGNFINPNPNTKTFHKVRYQERAVIMWVNGEVCTDQPTDLKRVLCDPKKVDYFTCAETGRKLETAEYIVLNERGCFYA